MASQIAEPDYSIRKFLKNLLFEQKGEDKAKKFHDYHLVVAALIAAVTFQACVNPPGGVWQDDSSDPKRQAGRAVYASDETAFYVFLAFNTLAFSSSMLLLICLTWGFPFFFEVVVAMASMGITYGASIFAITPKDFRVSRSLLSIAAVPVIARAAILIYKYVMWKWPRGQEEKKRKNVG